MNKFVFIEKVRGVMGLLSCKCSILYGDMLGRYGDVQDFITLEV